MKMLIWTIAVLFVVSCGGVIPSQDANGHPSEEVLTAIGPSIANTGDQITLEGTFGDTITVQFPGGTSQPAMPLGGHRATVTVPMTATDGDLTIVTAGATVGPLPFRRASFAMGLGAFESNHEQTEGARQGAAPATVRTNHTSVLVGSYLYILGGVNQSIPLNTVERATIYADGSLGPFAVVPDVALATARYACISAIIGRHLYVVGGFDNNNSLNTVERAAIRTDGSLEPFIVMPDVKLGTARRGHSSAIIGKYLYILGGIGQQGPLNSIERAEIHADGSLGPFATISDTTLMTRRAGHSSSVIGKYLYLVGGADNNGALKTVEQAAINADGSFGPLVILPDVTLATARSNHTSVVLGDYLYILGGTGTAGALSSVERATINANGSLAPFVTVPGTVLATVSSGHVSVIIGNYLYIFGGLSNIGPNSTERATINADGSLGIFTAAPVTLVTPRGGHSSAIVGRYIYLIGGASSSGALSSVERAVVHADGSLGPFVAMPAYNLINARSNHISAILGGYLYVLGGSNVTIERAPITKDGSLGSFAVVPGLNLVTARSYCTSAMIGKYLYVIGGFTNTSLNSIERTAVGTDGSLSAFANISSTLVTARHGATSAVLGNYLYVIGGYNSTGGALNSVERAMINSEGSLGPFVAVSGIGMTAARYYHTSAIIGEYLYMFGSAVSTSIERAMINPDGSIGAFASVPGGALTLQRKLATSAVIGNYLYILGGGVNSVERAAFGVEVH